MKDVFLWDSDEQHPSVEGTMVLWRQFSDVGSQDVVSIPHLVEVNSDSLRNRYLAWIHDLGEMQFRELRLLEHLQIRQNFSYWWMTLLVEKCNYSKSPQISNAIYLMAFIDWIGARAPSRIVLISSNQELASCVRAWCKFSGAVFKWQKYKPKAKPLLSWRRRVYLALPLPIQALAWLFYYLAQRASLSGVGLKKWQQTKGGITFISYLFNLKSDSGHKGEFKSDYWGSLPNALKEEGLRTNWLHIYVKDSLLPTAKHAANIIRKLNENKSDGQCHVTLDTFLTVKVVLCAIFDWLILLRIGVRLNKISDCRKSSSLDLWPLFRKDWQESLFGPTAMNNVLKLNLFESALKDLPRQRQGIYLQENQGWEFGFIYAWQELGHGKLIGMPHSTVRFWDLRYFFDPRSYLRVHLNDLPMPNVVACNGVAMRDSYSAGGYPSRNLADVEALRYSHLDEVKIQKPPVNKNDPIRLLVLGDYLPENTEHQMRLLVRAISLLRQSPLILVKPHPNCPINASDYPSLNMQVTMRPISKILKECDIAYSSAVTSAAVDAYCLGIPIISFVNPAVLNLSPLRGFVGVYFVGTPSGLADALTSGVKRDMVSGNKLTYFYVDHKLPRWRSLLLI